MGYLISQIVLCLVIAAVIGAAVGWFLRGALAPTATHAAAPPHSGGGGPHEVYEDHNDAELEAAHQRLHDIESELLSVRRTIGHLEGHRSD